jgi:hypothetical protein
MITANNQREDGRAINRANGQGAIVVFPRDAELRSCMRARVDFHPRPRFVPHLDRRRAETSSGRHARAGWRASGSGARSARSNVSSRARSSPLSQPLLSGQVAEAAPSSRDMRACARGPMHLRRARAGDDASHLDAGSPASELARLSYTTLPVEPLGERFTRQRSPSLLAHVQSEPPNAPFDASTLDADAKPKSCVMAAASR